MNEIVLFGYVLGGEFPVFPIKINPESSVVHLTKKIIHYIKERSSKEYSFQEINLYRVSLEEDDNLPEAAAIALSNDSAQKLSITKRISSILCEEPLINVLVQLLPKTSQPSESRFEIR